jgi:predicted acetyltransferase
MTLTIVTATRDDEPVLRQLFQLYFHDFSDWSGEDVDDQGFFDAWDDSTFDDEGSAAYLLRVDGRLAGFLVTETVDTPMGLRVEFADLFILRKYRRRGLALEVARRVMPGSGHPWLVAVFREDEAALRFWQRAFERLPFASVQPFADPAKPQYRFFAVDDEPLPT